MAGLIGLFFIFVLGRHVEERRLGNAKKRLVTQERKNHGRKAEPTDWELERG